MNQWKSRASALVSVALVVMLGALAAAACGGGSGSDNDADLPAYYASLGMAAATLDQRVSVYADHIQTSDDPDIGRSLGTFNSDLQIFAHDTDVLKPPSAVQDAHKQLVQATVDLGDAVLQLSTSGIGTHAPTQAEINFAVKQARAVKAWNDACKELQATAASKKIDVDLKCGTALHQRETPGI